MYRAASPRAGKILDVIPFSTHVTPPDPLHRSLDLDGCIAGRGEAWREFVRATAGIIHSAVRRSLERRGASPSDVDDCVQDVYVRLLREECRLLRTFDPKRAALTTWLTIIARTIVHERSKKRSGWGSRPMGDAADAIAAPQPDATAEPHATLDLPWHILSPQQQAVLQLLFREELSVEAAAAELGVDPQTIRSAKHKALSRLRDELVARRGGARPDVRGDERPELRLSISESDTDRDASRSPSIS